MTSTQEPHAKDGIFWLWLGTLSEEHAMPGIHSFTDLQIASPDRRIAAVLLRVPGATVPHPPLQTFCIRVAQTDLGDMANASRAVVSHAVGRPEAQAWIRVGCNRLDIPEPAKLTAFACGH